MEWFALLIPIVSIPIMRWFYPHKVVWWEFFIPLLPALMLIPLIKFTSEISQTHDVERWGGWVTEVRYYEDWDEWITKTCTKQVQTGRDSKGNPTYTTHTYDCSYRNYHPEHWVAYGSNGEELEISQSTYSTFKARFGTNKFVDMHRHYYHDDGDMYSSVWPNDERTLSPLFTHHSYTNKVQANDGIFEYEHLTKEDIALLHQFSELNNNFNDPAILGNHAQKPEADRLLQHYNAKYGSVKQIRYWVLLFYNQPRSVGLKQEALWKGGNKNEFVICINLDNDKATWCHCFCWSPDGHTGNDVMKIEVRDYVEQQNNFNLVNIINETLRQTDKNWKRKSFKEFDYLSVQTPTWAMITIYITTLITTIIACFYAINNEVNEKDHWDTKRRWSTLR